MNAAAYVFYALGLGLMVLGAVELIRCFSFWLHSAGGSRKDGQTGQMALVIVPKGPEDCESLVRAGGERVEWMALKPPCRLVCLDGGDPKTGEILDRLSLRYRNLERRRPEELPGFFAGLQEKGI